MLKFQTAYVAFKTVFEIGLMRLTAMGVLIFFVSTLQTSALELKNYKNDLFAYPKTLQSADGGDYRIIDYQELRDINGRDEVPERRVKRKYIDYAAKRAARKASLNTPSGNLNYYYVGKNQNASIITIYVHGRGGNGQQGMSDLTFGGNFNRIKMLMLKNGGLYLSPDAETLDVSSAERIAAMIKAHTGINNIPVVIACGSAGGSVCHALANNAQIAPRLKGIVFLGSFWSDQYRGSSALGAGAKTYIAHGSRDPIFAIDKMENFYRGIKSSGAPVKMVRFESGSHGTPIRMMDWREALNWILN